MFEDLYFPYDEKETYFVSCVGNVYSDRSKKILKPYINAGYYEVYLYGGEKRAHKRFI